MKNWLPYLVRILFSIVVGMAGAWLVSEISYQTLKDPQGRDQSTRIDLVIPAGTAERIAAGQNTLSLPDKMTFVEGDILVVKNLDSVSHQLGPVWVPPQSNGVLQLNQANDYVYACSFQTSKVLGIEVQPRLTATTRFEGILAMGLPSSVMLALYSFLIFPLKPRRLKEGTAA
jgi:hypothetical protein